MKTRGKGKTDTGITNYAKDTLDPRDFGDDGEDTNGYSEDRASDAAQSRSDARTARNGGNRRGSRIPRTVGARTKNDKALMESAEFQDVVRGFFDFIEEIKRKKKKEPKNGREPKPLKLTEEPDKIKKVKFDTQLLPQPAGKSDMQLEDFDKDKPLYSFKQDVNARNKELLDIKKKEAYAYTPPIQEQIDLRAKESQAPKQKEAPTANLGLPGATSYLPGANLPGLNNPQKQQFNKSLPNLYFDNPALFPGPDRLPLQNFADQHLLRSYYGMNPYENYGYGANSNQLLNYQLLEALLQKSQPELLASLLDPAQAGVYDLERQLQQYRNAQQQLGLGGQRFGNQPLGGRLVEAEPEVVNPKGFEGKLGRAATHVAIAYFIYFKSLDPESIAKADKTKMDPTYNARMLKEKRTDTYPPNEIPAMMDKLGPYYQGLPMNNNFPPNIDYLERRLMEGQRLPRNQDLPVGYQGKNEPKLEEEKAEAPKKKNTEAREAARQAARQKPPKEEDIINIDEGSDIEAEKPQQSAQKPEQKPSVTVETKAQPAVRAEQPKPKEKPEENVGNVSAEDIVQEIAELTGHSDGEKRKYAKRPQSKSASEENVKPVSQASAANPKTFAAGDESEAPQTHTETKNEPKGVPKKDEAQGIEVISSDEEPPKNENENKEKEAAQKEEKKEIEKQPEATDVNGNAGEKDEKAAAPNAQ